MTGCVNHHRKTRSWYPVYDKKSTGSAKIYKPNVWKNFESFWLIYGDEIPDFQFISNSLKSKHDYRHRHTEQSCEIYTP